MFGGAFDPPHSAHQALAQALIQKQHLDLLYIVPTGQAWHKSRVLSDVSHRLAMARLAFQNMPKVVVDDLETQRVGRAIPSTPWTRYNFAIPMWIFVFLWVLTKQPALPNGTNGNAYWRWLSWWWFNAPTPVLTKLTRTSGTISPRNGLRECICL